MTLAPGTTLGDYEVVAPIGSGGMGEVYRARDRRLGRDVAVKVLPESFSRDEQRLARLEREATLLASLNHPGIATLHSFEKADLPFLVMELVEGETLEERIRKGPIAVDEALPLFSQMAEAIEAAHDKGVIHRDLKPANVKITPDGRPKILDFGLAKGFVREAPESNVSESPTLTRGTADGVILGTASYMSPEQARGKALDARADVWAFGCVLYEALTAHKAFDGNTVADIIGAIVRAEPRWESLPRATPLKLRELLERCLRKDARHRLRHMGDAWIALEDARVEEPQDLATERRPTALLVTALVALVAMVATGLAAWSLTRSTVTPPRPVLRTELSLPPDTELAFSTHASALAISPDSRHVAFVARRGEATALYLRALDRAEAVLVDKGEGAMMPFFSPDSEWLGFVSENRDFMKVSVSGGAAVRVAEKRPGGRGVSWTPDGSLVFNPGLTVGLSRVSDNGGELEVLTSPDSQRREVNHRYPEVLPGGNAVLFTVATADIDSYGDAPIGSLSFETGEYEVVLEGGTHPRYSHSGHLVYARDGSLLAVRFDPDTLRVSGTPVPVLDGVTMKSQFGNAEFSLSRDGTLLYAAGDAGKESNRVVRVDCQGRSTPLIDTPDSYSGPKFSPDGRLLALTISTANSSVWVYDLERRSMTRVTFGWGNHSPIWNPDGQRLSFASNRAGVWNLHQKSADGSGEVERLSPSDLPQLLGASWSPDGSMLVFTGSPNISLWLVSMDGDRKREPFVQSEFRALSPAFSPDGRWIAYQSNESGQSEVYVRPVPPEAGRWQASVGGGQSPVWNPNGRELFYRNGNKMMVVDVATVGDELRFGNPRLLFEKNFRGYDVSPDGQNFVMIEPGESSPAPTKLNLILNWSEELKRLVPDE